MRGIEVSGTSLYHSSRPNYLRVSTDVLANKTPRVEETAKTKFGPDSEAAVAENQFARYSGRRSLLNTQKITYNTHRASLTLSEQDPGATGPRTATLTYNGKGGKEEVTFTLTADTRITWDDQGNPLILQGADALTKGSLKAHGGDEILLRLNAGTVEGGDGSTTVINLSESSAVFKGGKGDMTFYGSYLGADIISGEGENNYLGVFTDCSITGGGGDDTFAGFFLGSLIKGGNGNDIFSGLFLKGCELQGEEGDDKFTGEFSQAVIFGGEGKNFYGIEAQNLPQKAAEDKTPHPLEAKYQTADDDRNTPEAAAPASGAASLNTGLPPETGAPAAQDLPAMAKPAVVVSDLQNGRPGVANQFQNVTIEDDGDGSELEGVFLSADIRLRNGSHQMRGVLYDSRVNAEEARGSDINLAFASQSRVSGGAGDDNIRMTTAENSDISGGGGVNNLVMGADGSVDSRTMQLGNLKLDLESTEFLLPGQSPTASGKTHGYLAANSIDASGDDTGGDSSVTVATGDAVERMHVERKAEDEREKPENGTAAPKEGEKEGSAPTTPPVAQLRVGDAMADAVTVRMSENEQRRFSQSYEARRPKTNRYCTFSSAYNFSKMA